MHVQLLSHTPIPEQVVAAAARLCYSESSIEQLLGQAPEQIAKMLQKILELGHFSVLEHASFTSEAEGEEWSAHRIARLNRKIDNRR